MKYANYNGASQPAHPRRLISAFIVRCLDSIILLPAISKLSGLQPVSVAEQPWLSLTWSQTPENMFSRDVAHFVSFFVSLSSLSPARPQGIYCELELQ